MHFHSILKIKLETVFKINGSFTKKKKTKGKKQQVSARTSNKIQENLTLIESHAWAQQCQPKFFGLIKLNISVTPKISA